MKPVLLGLVLLFPGAGLALAQNPKVSAPKPSAAALRHLPGTYRLPNRFTIEIVREDGRLFAKPRGKPRYEIFPKGGRTFTNRDGTLTLAFGRPRGGTVEELVLRRRGRKYVARKLAEVRPVSIADGIYKLVVRDGFPANIVAAVDESGFLLVDSGFESTAGELARALASISDKPVRTIVTTHPHGDHIGGNARLGGQATIVCHEKAAPRLGGKKRAIQETTTLRFAGQDIEIVPLPGGHSNADLAVHFTKAKVLCLGDLYLSESFPTAGREGDPDVLLRNLGRAAKRFPPDVRIVAGHGRDTTMQELRRYAEMVRTTIGLVREEKAKGKDLDQVLAARPLRDYAVWGRFFPFITEETWTRQIFDRGVDASRPTERTRAEPASLKNLPHPRFTVLFNHIAKSEDLETAWGFACLVEGYEKRILFDTGLDGEKLLANMKALGVEPKSIDLVVLSHSHGDHTNGLEALLGVHPEPTVYPLASFPAALRDSIRSRASRVVPVRDPIEILPGVQTTGEMGTAIPEQALVLDTAQGLVVLTGCAHPGIVEMVVRAKQLRHRRIHLVMGGFHLGGHSAAQVQSIIRELKDLGVEKVAATHCTGDAAIAMFREAWGADFVTADCGSVFRL